MDEEHGTVIISEEQTSGRGRLGRNWVSPKYKGIWMSIILRPNIITAKYISNNFTWSSGCPKGYYENGN